MPSTGTVLHVSEPTGAGIRVDSGMRSGAIIGTDFDPMIAKVIASGTDRSQALARLDQALQEMTILGVNTNLEYLQHLITDPDVAAGHIDTTLVEARLPKMVFQAPHEKHAQMAAWFMHQQIKSPSSAWSQDGFRLAEAAAVTYRVHSLEEDPKHFEVSLDTNAQLLATESADRYVYQDASGSETVTIVAEPPSPEGTRIWLATNEYTGMLVVLGQKAQVLYDLATLEAEERGVDPQVRAPLPGTVTALHVPDGSYVAVGEPVVTIEAMKMEHQLKAPIEGTVTIHIISGQQVSLDQNILTVTGEEIDKTE